MNWSTEVNPGQIRDIRKGGRRIQRQARKQFWTGVKISKAASQYVTDDFHTPAYVETTFPRLKEIGKRVIEDSKKQFEKGINTLDIARSLDKTRTKERVIDVNETFNRIVIRHNSVLRK